MSQKKVKGKKSRPIPKQNHQIPNSMIRPLTFIGLSHHLQHAREYPIYGCWIMEGWQDEGISPVIVARKQETGRVLFGAYMVDLFCLGIKDAFSRADYSVNKFERDLPDMCHGAPEQCSVELAHEVIYGALEYAAKLGFQPHSDFSNQMADLILDPPDAHPRVDHVTFGKDGKPLYIAGPYDDEKKISYVMDTLTRTCGEGNFHFLVGFGDMPD